ncbi:MAG: glycosyltransferase family 2 protein [Nitrospirota bacterium]|nr:glycosyltransferase family 2 protein [Nitrospirota bacterium]MDE3224016.1 glycosyltransferase family 2 protein [Nitrospirota bacterium]MDE3242955.1 glycosyltransferase family 2 protein [Nitrospirota bacterium]
MMRGSVVIPLYNARDVIRETVQSVLDQTWQDFELVAVDDGSIDGSGDLIQALAPRLRYVRQENAGVAAARNRSIAEARGLAFSLGRARSVKTGWRCLSRLVRSYG